MSIEDAIHDEARVHYYAGVTSSLLAAVKEDGVDVRGYFGWSECIQKLSYFRTTLIGLGIF